jgi:ABC-type multidrug transport system fused ATPase/permease subunit
MIAVVNGGKIVEQGTHDELMSLEGQYFQLAEAQNTAFSVDESPRRQSEFVNLKSIETGNGAPALLFRDVHFRYPARKNIEVFKGLNLSVRAGETLALVGPRYEIIIRLVCTSTRTARFHSDVVVHGLRLCYTSGHGKSTTIQLIERFYDPDSGSVELDGVDLKELNVHWLREQFGLVSQEPVLFDTTILENIRFGFPGATQEQVESAATLANAHNFIVEFPDGYETQVGEGGTQVSGGKCESFTTSVFATIAHKFIAQCYHQGKSSESRWLGPFCADRAFSF